LEELLKSTDIINRTIGTLEQLADDDRYKPDLLASLRETGEWEVRCAVRAMARHFEIDSYLEIGVRRGWSLAQVIDERPQVDTIGVDTWQYGDSSPDFVYEEMGRLFPNRRGRLIFETGSSHDIVPALACHGMLFDIALIDGDHFAEGAAQDLADVAPIVRYGLVFDDLLGVDENGKLLHAVWSDFKAAHDEFSYIENFNGHVPSGIAIREANYGNN